MLSRRVHQSSYASLMTYCTASRSTNKRQSATQTRFRGLQTVRNMTGSPSAISRPLLVPITSARVRQSNSVIVSPCLTSFTALILILLMVKPHMATQCRCPATLKSQQTLRRAKATLTTLARSITSSFHQCSVQSNQRIHSTRFSRAHHLQWPPSAVLVRTTFNQRKLSLLFGLSR